MGKKRRRRRTPETPEPAFEANPFADLDLDLPDPEAPPAAPAKAQLPTGADAPDDALTPEDAELLAAFGGNQSLETPTRSRGSVSFNIRRRGRGGKTVTTVSGLAALPLPSRMALCKDVRKALGTGARFNDDVLEIQGDQRQRAPDWFAAHGFRVKGVSGS